MSAIAGHIGLAGNPTVRLDRMLDACACRGSYQPHAELISGALPGALGHAGHRATEHSIDEPRPFRHETGVMITADIRLDNRAELRSQLGLGSRPTGDAELAVLAYLRWGIGFAEHLVGDYAIAIFDPRSGEMVLARDHLGVRPVLYAVGSDWLVFGSTLASVRDGADQAFTVYVDKLQHTMLDPLEVIEPDTTFYRGILRLPAASTLRWTPGQSPRISTYWRPQRGELTLNSDQEYHEAFREAFDRAIACRLQTTRPVAAMLSGGLDSSSVVARAHTMVTDPLRTYGFVEASPEEDSDGPHIRACQQAFPGEHFDFDEHQVASEYDLDEILADPDSAFDANMGTLWATSQRLNASEFGVVLTGIGGDEVVATTQRRYADELLHSGQRVQAFREMSRSDGHWTFNRLARFAGSEFGPRFLIERFRQSRPASSRFRARLERAGIDPGSEDGRRLTASLETLSERPEWNTGDGRVDRVAAPMLTIGLERYDRVGARHGIEVRHPMSDKRFIEFCLSLPSHQLQRGGWSKHILRAAITELPASVAWRPKEVRGMGPLAAKVHEVHGPDKPVPPLPGVFGQGPATSEPRDHWDRHIASKWWQQHGG